MKTPKRGQLVRVKSEDFSTAEEVLSAAEILLVPDGQTQRKAFEKLMPQLYVLRNRGCSWVQLTKLLGDCGFKLQPSVVRNYFGEMLATRMDICQARMNEQIFMLDAIRKGTKGTDISGIAGRVATALSNQRSMAAPKIDELFGHSGKPAPAPAAPRQKPAPQTQAAALPQSHSESGEYGLFGLPASSPGSKGKPAFFNLDEKQPAPNVRPSPAPEMPRNVPQRPSEPLSSHSGAGPNLKCRPLQEGVVPLKKREGVPVEVYQPGYMEHPAIPGLSLSLPERLYGAALEYFDPSDAEIKLESGDARRFRVTWRRPVPATATRTGNTFIEMDVSLFPIRAPKSALTPS